MEKSLFRQRLSSNQMSQSWKWGSHSTFPSDLQQIEQIWIWWSWEKWYFFLCYKKEEREQYCFHHKICPGSVHSYQDGAPGTWIWIVELATQRFVGYTKHSSVWNSLNQQNPGGNVKTQKSTPGSGSLYLYLMCIMVCLYKSNCQITWDVVSLKIRPTMSFINLIRNKTAPFEAAQFLWCLQKISNIIVG